jgi:hypothetical protein
MSGSLKEQKAGTWYQILSHKLESLPDHLMAPSPLIHVRTRKFELFDRMDLRLVTYVFLIKSSPSLLCQCVYLNVLFAMYNMNLSICAETCSCRVEGLYGLINRLMDDFS